MKKLIILAAGEGKRLRPFTSSRPKCLVDVLGETILERNIQQWKKTSNVDLLVVSGFKSFEIEKLNFPTIHNSDYAISNMVWSLSLTLPLLKDIEDEYIYISYGDVILSSNGIESLEASEEDFSIVADVFWEKLWSLRMDDYLKDVETFKFKNAEVIELGKEPKSKDEVEAQYIGVIKIKRDLLIHLLANYKGSVDNAPDRVTAEKYMNMYMTDFIQDYIDDGGRVVPVFIYGGWLEVDTVQDLEVYEQNLAISSLFEDLTI